MRPILARGRPLETALEFLNGALLAFDEPSGEPDRAPLFRALLFTDSVLLRAPIRPDSKSDLALVAELVERRTLAEMRLGFVQPMAVRLDESDERLLRRLQSVSVGSEVPVAGALRDGLARLKNLAASEADEHPMTLPLIAELGRVCGVAVHELGSNEHPRFGVHRAEVTVGATRVA